MQIENVHQNESLLKRRGAQLSACGLVLVFAFRHKRTKMNAIREGCESLMNCKPCLIQSENVISGQDERLESDQN